MKPLMGIEGAAEIAQAFKEFGPKFERRVMRAAINAGNAEFVRLARQKALALKGVSASARQRLRHAITQARVRTRKGEMIGGLFIASRPKPKKVRGRTVLTNDPRLWGMWINSGTKDRFRRLERGGTAPTGKIKKQPWLDDTMREGETEALAALSAEASRRLALQLRREERRRRRAAQAARI